MISPTTLAAAERVANRAARITAALPGGGLEFNAAEASRGPVSADQCSGSDPTSAGIVLLIDDPFDGMPSGGPATSDHFHGPAIARQG